jgi:chromatin segregation and condensation protein Rec8/ScpA/Scc1 (kleisin family)
MATKYLETFKEMVSKYEKEFDDFQELHDKYETDPKKWQEEFNKEGAKIMDIVRDYENRLCGKMENTMNATYSANLAEKFRSEIKRYLPKLDMIGVVINFQ